MITTPLTFCATVNTVLHTGATPVLCDVERGSMNIDVRNLRACVTPRTKAVLPVHFAGRPCEMDEVLAVARDHGLVVIEDCAHAIEARYRGAAVGTLGDYGCFSFYATKNLTTGEGGMVLARGAAQLARVRRLSMHGMTQDAWQRHSGRGFGQYDVVECGFKYNMMDLEAAIGLHQLRRLESGLERRSEIWSRYQRAFADLPVTLPAPVPPHMRHALHLYTLLLDEGPGRIGRDLFVERMAQLQGAAGTFLLPAKAGMASRRHAGRHVDRPPVGEPSAESPTHRRRDRAARPGGARGAGRVRTNRPAVQGRALSAKVPP